MRGKNRVATASGIACRPLTLDPVATAPMVGRVNKQAMVVGAKRQESWFGPVVPDASRGGRMTSEALGNWPQASFLACVVARHSWCYYQSPDALSDASWRSA